MKRGDHIKVSRGLYSHHGIYLGKGRVIHYTGDAWEKITGERDSRVRRDSLATFRGAGTVEVVRHKKSASPETIVRRAESRLGETRYNLLVNNCEHFATECVTGVKRSKQVERAAATATTVIGPGGTIATPVAFAAGPAAAAVVAAGTAIATADPKTRKAAAKTGAGAAGAAGAATVAAGAAVAVLGVAAAPVAAPVALIAGALGLGLPKLKKKKKKTSGKKRTGKGRKKR